MCGIAGLVVNPDERSRRMADLDRMTDRLAHRGPDGRGIHWATGKSVAVGLGHRRLSIIDLAGGGQPLANETDDVWITFNGEIYNYVELRQDLCSRGHLFKTHSDTETIVHLYEEYGHDCLQFLRGMFAFAIWDTNKQELFFARDRLGEKPFVYAQFNDTFAFSSELKSLRCLNDFPTDLDPEAIDLYLSLGYVPHPWTIYQSAKKLPPAHYGIFAKGRLNLHQYWQPNTEPDFSLTRESIHDRVGELVHDAVRLQLRSDVPVGAFLSGGIDSTSIVIAAQAELDDPLNTYTIGFDNPEFDESQVAKSTAARLGTNHHELQLQCNADSLLDQLLDTLDEPFADSSAVSTLLVTQLAATQLKVVLTGDGGDEQFAGYDRYHTIDKMQRMECIPGLTSLIGKLPIWNWLSDQGDGLAAKAARRARLMREPFRLRFSSWHVNFSETEKARLFDQGHPSACLAKHRLAGLVDESRSRFDASRAMHADLKMYLPDDLLYKVDTMSMAHGIECRAPLLDHKLVEFVSQIPFPRHRRRGVTKPVLTNAFANQIPENIRRQPKRGFGIPTDDWLTGSLQQEFAKTFQETSRLSSQLGISRTNLQRLWDEHSSRQMDHSQRLWNLYILEAWLNKHLPTDRIHRPATTLSAG